MPTPRLCFSATAALLVVAATSATASDGNLAVQFKQCTEFVGLAAVDATAARALVPAAYAPVVNAQGATLVVRVADCLGVRVGGLPSRAGRVAQIGLIVASPDGTATDPNTSINNYTLTYASNDAALVAALALRGVPAKLDVGLAIESNPIGSTGASSFYAAVSPELDAGPTWFLHGSVNAPAVPTNFLANWWRNTDGQGHGPANRVRQVKMATQIAAISFDFGSVVSFTTSRQNLVGKLLGSHQVAAFPVSFRGAFAAGTMTVTSALVP